MPFYFGNEEGLKFEHKGIEGGLMAKEINGQWLAWSAINIPGKCIWMSCFNEGKTKEEALEEAKRVAIESIDQNQ